MPLPSSIALTNVADGSQVTAAPHRNNYSAIQTAVNGLISSVAVLAGPGTFNIKDYGAVGDGVTDDAAACQTAITAAAAVNGTVLIPGGTWTWKTVPAIPAGITGKLRILGQGAKVVLTSTGPRLFDFAGIAADDHRIYQNIEIGNLAVDAGLIGGLHHVIIGNYVGGPQGYHFNVDGLYIHDMEVTRVYTEDVPPGANHRLGVWIVPFHQVANEATQNYVQNVLIERVRITGGNQGFTIAGQNVAGDDLNTNIYLDNIVFNKLYFDSGVQRSSNYSGTAFFIGSHAFGGKAVIRDCIGKRSPDTGVEVNGLEDILVDNVRIEDAARGAFLHRNFNSRLDSSKITLKFANCKAVVTSGATAALSQATIPFRIYSTLKTGRVVFEDCTSLRSHTALPVNPQGEIIIDPTAGFEGVVVRNFTSIWKGWTYTTASLTTLYVVVLNATNGQNYPVRVEGVRAVLNGAISGAGTVRYVGALVLSSRFLISDVDVALTVTGAPGAGCDAEIVNLGQATSTVSGEIIRCRYESVAATNFSIRGVQISNSGGTTLTITDWLKIRDCDFTLAAGADVFFVDTPFSRNKVLLLNNRYTTWPKPSAAMGATNFAAATFTTATGNQYIGGAPAEIHFATGTGAGITAIDVSKDGSTYENAYTQASGAMAQSVLVPVDNGDSVKVTFATTQPTTRVRYRR